MTENRTQQTAQILQFPAGGRAGLNMQTDIARIECEAMQKQPKTMLGGGCWYHDEAMNEQGFDNAG